MATKLNIDRWINHFKTSRGDQSRFLIRSLISSPDFERAETKTRSLAMQAALDFDGGTMWLQACLENMDPSSMREAVNFGLRFSCDQIRTNQAFATLLDTCGPFLPGDYHEGMGLAKTAADKASVKAKIPRDGLIKAQLWALAIEAGALKVGADARRPRTSSEAELRDDEVLSIRDLEGSYRECGLWALHAEALRGGALDESSCWPWHHAGLFAGGPSDALWEGLGALGWAAKQGLDIQNWPAATFRDRKENWRSVAGNIELDAHLARLHDFGARVKPEDSMASTTWVPGRNDRLSLMGALLESEISPAGIATASSMGARALDLSLDGQSIIETLFDLGAAGLAGRARALLAAADKVAPGGAATLLAHKAKDGSGPMHWAAQALCAEAVALFAEHGLDVHARDSAGKTPGHLAAKRYGAKNQKKVEPTLRALSSAGFDWASLDKKGGSALAALAAKGPIEPLADIVKSAPDSLSAQGGDALAAQGILAKRGGAALAAVESVVLAADGQAAPSKKGRGRSL